MRDELDRSTLASARQGDPEAFRQIVEAYQGLIYNVCYRHVYHRDRADDLAQECFIRLYENFDQYDLSRPFRPWFMRLAVNAILNRLRSEKRFQSVAVLETLDGIDRGAADNDPSPAAQAASAEGRKRIRQEVQALPPEHRTAVALHYFEEMSLGEIAQSLSTPVGTVKTWLYRARDRLKQRLKDLEDGID